MAAGELGCAGDGLEAVLDELMSTAPPASSAWGRVFLSVSRTWLSWDTEQEGLFSKRAANGGDVLLVVLLVLLAGGTTVPEQLSCWLCSALHVGSSLVFCTNYRTLLMCFTGIQVWFFIEWQACVAYQLVTEGGAGLLCTT